MFKMIKVVIAVSVMLMAGNVWANGPSSPSNDNKFNELSRDVNVINQQGNYNTEAINANKIAISGLQYGLDGKEDVIDSYTYVGLIGGMTFNTNSDIDTNEMSFNNGYYAGINVGQTFNDFRFEVEVAHQDTENTNTVWSNDTKLDTLVANVYYNVPVMGRVSVYGMGGLGMGLLDVTNNGLNGSNSAFVSNVGAGITYKVNEALDADLGYKFIMLADTVVNDTMVSYNTSVATAGMRYMF